MWDTTKNFRPLGGLEDLPLAPQKYCRAHYRSKYFCLQSTLCGYSKLVSRDAWHKAKDQNSIWSSWAEKTSQNWWKFAEIQIWGFSAVFGRFLSPGWSDWILSEELWFFTLNNENTSFRDHEFYLHVIPAKYVLVKSSNRQYLCIEAENEKSKTTLSSQTFEVPENQVP